MQLAWIRQFLRSANADIGKVAVGVAGKWLGTTDAELLVGKGRVWKRVYDHLAQDADNEDAMIDSTIVRAHQHNVGALKKGAAKLSGAAKAG